METWKMTAFGPTWGTSAMVRHPGGAYEEVEMSYDGCYFMRSGSRAWRSVDDLVWDRVPGHYTNMGWYDHLRQRADRYGTPAILDGQEIRVAQRGGHWCYRLPDAREDSTWMRMPDVCLQAGGDGITPRLRTAAIKGD